MSNTNAPFGFRPIKPLQNSIPCNYYKVASSASRIGKGDLVAYTSAGFIQRESSSVAVGPWVGIALRDSGVLATGGISKFPVCDDPNMVYEVQSIATVALATTDLNQIYKAKCSVAADTSTGNSKNALTATLATATNGVRLLRLVDAPDNDSASANPRVEVRLNALHTAPGTAGV
jgi:hypothetical protein